MSRISLHFNGDVEMVVSLESFPFQKMKLLPFFERKTNIRADILAKNVVSFDGIFVQTGLRKVNKAKIPISFFISYRDSFTNCNCQLLLWSVDQTRGSEQ